MRWMTNRLIVYIIRSCMYVYVCWVSTYTCMYLIFDLNLQTPQPSSLSLVCVCVCVCVCTGGWLCDETRLVGHEAVGYLPHFHLSLPLCYSPFPLLPPLLPPLHCHYHCCPISSLPRGVAVRSNVISLLVFSWQIDLVLTQQVVSMYVRGMFDRTTIMYTLHS